MASFAQAMADRTPFPKRLEFVEKAKILKNEGNEHYRKLLEECKKPVDGRDSALLEKFQKDAKRSYHTARLQAQAAYPFNTGNYKQERKEKNDGASTSAIDKNAELEKECYELIASIYNNLAAVILAYPGNQKIEDYERAAEFCSNVLLIQNDNAKAMYRKAQALEKAGQLTRALTYYRDADLAENHKNAAVQRDLARLQNQMADAKKISDEELKNTLQRGLTKTGLGLKTDSVVYGKKEKKKKSKKTSIKHDPDSPSRGSSCSPSSSSKSGSSSSGRSSDEE